MTRTLDILGDDATLARQAADLAAQCGYEAVCVFCRERPPALPGAAQWVRSDGGTLPESDNPAFVGLSDMRARLEAIRLHAQRELVNLVHPAAVVNSSARFGRNVFVDAFAYVGLEAELADGVVMNSRSTAEHDNVIGEGVTFGTGATLCGRVAIGGYSFIGAGAVVRPQTRVAEGVTLGAGAIVVADITEPGVYVGSPARRLG